MQKRAIQSCDLLRGLVKSSSYIILHTMDGEIVGASPAAAEELGYTADEIKQIYLANIKPKTLRLSDVCKSNKELEAPVIFERRNGRRFPAKVQSTVLRTVINRAETNVIQLEFSVLNNVSDKNQPEFKLDLRESADYLQLLAQEVSTPTNGIVSALSLLKNTPLNDEQEKLLTVISDASAELGSITGQVVDTFKLGVNTFQLTPQPFNLIDLLDDLIDCNESRMQAQSVDLCLSVDALIPELVFGDAPRLRQLFDSLMRVVFKYCTRGQVAFHVKAATEGGSGAGCTESLGFELSFSSSRLELANTNRILQMLKRSTQDRTRSQPDFGIHLAIAEKLIQLMGGRLEFNASGIAIGGGEGAGVFSFEIKLPEVHSLDMAANTGFLSGKRVLLLDSCCSSLAMQLRQWGASVDQFSSLAEACEQAGLEGSIGGKGESAAYNVSIINQGVNGEYQFLTEAFRALIAGSHFVFLKADPQHTYLESAIEMPAPYRLGQLGNELAKLLETDYPYPYTYNTRRRLLKEQNVHQRLLLVEDSPSYRNVTTEMLAGAQYDVDLAYNGIDAVLACAETQYALILMDIQMPYMDGIEATTHIRKNCKRNAQTPILALSGDTTENTRVALESVGIRDALVKPVNADQLLAAVATLLSGEESIGLSQELSIDDEMSFLQRRTADCSSKSSKKGAAVLNTEILDRLVADTSWQASYEMIEIYIDETELSMDSILEGCKNSDVTKIAQQAHAIKSASRTFGCDSLHNITRQIEERALESDINACLELVKSLPAVFAASCDLLDAFKNDDKNNDDTNDKATPKV